MADDPYLAVLQRVAPGGRFVRRWPLRGGVSARIEAIEFDLPGGARRRVVVRQHGAAEWKPAQTDVTTREFALLEALHQIGLPVPEPHIVDTSLDLLPAPYLVMAYVDGTTDVDEHALPAALRQMADLLARIHALDLAEVTLPPLAHRDDPIPGALEHLPTTDETASLRASLTASRAHERPHAPALVHGDFWPGNILWSGGQIAAVLDWEDAAIGDPLSDLAGSRVELLWRYGWSAMEDFTTHYLSRTQVDPSNLPLWEIHVAAGAAAYMQNWGLDPELEAEMRRKTADFLAHAEQQLPSA